MFNIYVKIYIKDIIFGGIQGWKMKIKKKVFYMT